MRVPKEAIRSTEDTSFLISFASPSHPYLSYSLLFYNGQYCTPELHVELRELTREDRVTVSPLQDKIKEVSHPPSLFLGSVYRETDAISLLT